MVGAVPWPAPRERRWLPALAALAIVAGAGSATWLAWRGRGQTPARAGTNAGPATLPLPASASPAATSTPAGLRASAPGSVVPLTAGPLAGPARLPESIAATARPLAPAAADKADPASSLQLQAISERDGKPVAILSSRLVHEGDHFDGITVVRIGADEVEIEVQGRRRTLRF
ncbi:MAG: hypothetical protein DMF80_14770 [Acidobacteria bacterium]|nr:MAG: hypothetical protein DMF80_14770 [Acidobacteriota bacterium]PYQ23139.1 MAG: hypothetical protein DMF81_09735 [Acidobacteriota bacterium]